MALVVKDRVRETTTTTGTGTVTLAGAVAGFQSFSVIGNGNTTYYTITDGTNWEVGIGTYTSSGTTLSRDTILESSNGGTAVNFGAGTKDVFVTYPAEESVYQDGASIAAGTSVLAVANGGTGTNTAFTAGSVVFAGTSGVYTQDNANLFWDDTNNRLGIGTDAPLSLLHISGDSNPVVLNQNTSGSTAAFTALGVTEGASFGVDATGAYITSSASAVFSTNYTERMRITSAGNVGIGTSSPTSRLTITGGVTEIRDGNYLMLRPSGNAWDMRLQATGTQLDILSGGALGSPIMSLVNGGNVGIGTSSPSHKLDVQGSGSVYVRARSLDTTGATIGYVGAEFAGGSALQMRAGLGYTYLVSTGASDPLLFGTNTTERMRIDSSGNVGIGTSSPSYKLDVVSGDTTYGYTARLRANATAGYSRLQFTDSGATAQWAALSANSSVLYVGADGGTMVFQTSGSERVRINSSGNVGIGTTSPDAKLDILGTTSDQLRLRTAETEEYRIGRNSSTGYLDFYGSQTGYTGYVFGGVDGERLRIDSSGNVGIGTGAPLSLLHVAGDSNPVVLNQNTSGSTAAFTALGVTEGASFGVDATGAYITSSASAVFSTNYTERMRVTSAGNVGIGTSSPGTRLQVRDAAAPSGFSSTSVRVTRDNYGADFVGYIDQGVGSGAIISTVDNGTPTERMRINSSGNVGIGTSSPGKTLDLVGQFRASGAAGSGYALLEYGTSGTASNNWHVGSEGDGTFRWYNGNFGAGTERMRITSAGNVGIGTSSPASPLQVVGAGRFGAGPGDATNATLAIYNDGTGVSVEAFQGNNATVKRNLWLNAYGGNVGIGTTSPGQKLTVAGTVESTSGGFKFPDGTTQTTGVLEQVDVYTTIGSTTWTKPSWAKSVQVILIGGGGGGGSGRKGVAGTLRTGGAGGGGGAFSTTTLRASYLGSTVTVTVGGGGAGGASQTVNSTNGNAGTNGGTSSFGTILYAPGGSGGGGGSASGGTPGAFARGTFAGGQGGLSSSGGGSGSGITATTVGFNGGAYGGAGGGSVTVANANTGGGQGVNTASSTAPGWKVGGFQATPASNSVSGAGSSGSDNDSDTWLGGESGSGGGSSISGNAFNGGDGGNWGGGGGGGGGAVDSVGDSGAGGTGGDGIVVVISRG